jgi:hypothetical protein
MFHHLQEREATCPNCGCVAGLATGHTEPPKGGDLTFCGYCGAVRLFVAENGKFVRHQILSPAEIEALPERDRESLAVGRATYEAYARRVAANLTGKDPSTLTKGQRVIVDSVAAFPPEPETLDVEGLTTTIIAPSDALVRRTLAGKIFALNGEDPILILAPGPNGPSPVLPMFSEAWELRQTMKLLRVEEYKIEEISEKSAVDFLRRLPSYVTIGTGVRLERGALSFRPLRRIRPNESDMLVLVPVREVPPVVADRSMLN